MEQFGEEAELELRRQRVAAFIQDSLQPAKHLLEEGLLDNVDQDVTKEAQGFEVREYQLDAWGALWDARQKGAKTGLIHLATGLGKTSVGVFDVIKYRSEYKGRRANGPRILFASHKNEINTQAAERFAAFIPDASQGFFNGHQKDRDADLTFATLQSLHASLDSFKSGYFDYIIYDEAHHGKADTFEKVIQHFNPKFELALTATPNRHDSLNIRELFGHELYSKGLAEALSEGLLADPDYHIVFDDAVKEAMQSGFEPTTMKALNELFSVEPRNEVIAQNIRDEMDRIGLEFGAVKTIVFCQNIEHAADMAELLGGEPYHSRIPKNQRTNTLERFKAGEFQVITTRDMFNEGVDIPDARLLIFLRSTASPTVFEQQLGRGLRKYAGKETVSVLDFAANIDRIAIVRELAQTVKGLKHSRVMTETSKTGIQEFVIDDYAPGEEGEITENGLMVHTNHGDFDFDKLSVDLLEKYNALRYENAEPAPEGWEGLSNFAKIHRSANPTVVKILERLDAKTLPIYSFKGRPIPALSPELQQRILEEPEFNRRVPEGYMSISGFAAKNGVTPPYIEGGIKRLGLELESYQFTTAFTWALSPEQQAILMEEPLIGVQLASSEWISTRKLRDELKISAKNIDLAIQALGIEPIEMKFGPKMGLGVSRDQVERLKDYIEQNKAKDAPPEVVSLPKFGKIHRVAPQTLQKLIERLELKPPTFRFGSIDTVGITPEIGAILLQEPELKTPLVPEGWQSVNRFSENTGIHISKISRIIKELGLELESYRHSNGIFLTLSPEQQQKIIDNA